MCIRDRKYTVEGIQDPERQQIYRKLIVSVYELADIVYNACLLYTSDAADERSSVDLGGRRIIKKKNKRHARHCVTVYDVKQIELTQCSMRN